MHGLKAREFKAADQMIGSISCRLEMEDMLEHPAGLSSGQKQRVALERDAQRRGHRVDVDRRDRWLQRPGRVVDVGA